MSSASLKEIFCYFHIGGQFVKNAEGKMHYEGGRSKGRVIKEGMTHEELIRIITSCMEYQSNGAEMKYTVKFDSSTLLDLEDDEGVVQLIKFNDNCAHVYIVEKGNQIRETSRKSSQGLDRSPENASASSPSSHVPEAEFEAIIQRASAPIQRKSSRLLMCSSRNACVSSPSSHEPEAGVEAIPCTILSAPAPIQRKSSRLLMCSSRNTIASSPSSPEPESISCAIQSASVPMLGLNTAKWKDLFVGVGQTFDNAVAFRQALYKYSIAHKFSYIFVKNTSKKMIVKCKIDGCKWKITAYTMAKTDSLLSVKSFHNEHIHSAQDNLIVSHMARSNLTSSIIIDEIKSSVEKPPNEIRRDFFREFGVSLSYGQAVRGKKRALEEMHGPSKHTFMLVPWMCERLMENDPKTVAKWSASTDNRFERFFIAYACCINGFLLGSRPILYLDGRPLKGHYKLTFLAASAYDADNELFPFAYAIVCGETFDEWSWFLDNVKEIIGSVQVTIVSDRHSAIIDAVKAIFGDERHAYCYWHLREDFRLEVTNFNKGMGRNCGINVDDTLKLLDAIACARLEGDFDIAMGKLRSLSPSMAQWLETNGDIDRWALSRFTSRRWDNIATNLAESFNIWLVKEIDYNVCVLIHEHQEKLAKKLCARKEATTDWKNGVGPNIEAKLNANVLMAENMEAENCGPNTMSVRTGLTNFSVNLESRDCTCQAWQMSGIPCLHACAAIKKVDGNVYAYVEECYLLSSQQKIYSSTMIPVEINDMPRLNARETNDQMSQTFLKPPLITRSAGRPQVQSTRRRESQFQQKKVYHCSRCQELGHTRRKCKNLDLLESTSNCSSQPVTEGAETCSVKLASQPCHQSASLILKKPSTSLAERRGNLSKSLKLPLMNDKTLVNRSSTFNATREDGAVMNGGTSRLHQSDSIGNSSDLNNHVKGRGLDSTQLCEVLLCPGAADSVDYSKASFVENSSDSWVRSSSREDIKSTSSNGMNGSGLLQSNKQNLVYKWPSLEKIVTFGANHLDSKAAFVIFSSSTSSVKHARNILYFWLGNSFSCAASQVRLDHNREIDCRGGVDWNQVGCDILARFGLPNDTIPKIIKENEEPEEFLALLSTL